MSTFSHRFTTCMTGGGLAVPSIESLAEAKEFIEHVHSAWENAGADVEMTIGALLVVGAVVGLDEAALIVLDEVAGVLVTAYIVACIGCLASSGVGALRDLFAMSPSQPFMSEQLAELGIEVDEAGTVIA